MDVHVEVFERGDRSCCGLFLFLKREKDIDLMLTTLAFCMVGQLVFVLKQRYVDGIHRVIGGFEHSNPLAMWGYFCALPLLAAALSRKATWKQSMIYFIGFGSGVLVILLTVTRTSLAIVGVGSVMLVFLALLQGITYKRIAVVCLLGFGGLFVVGKGFDTVYGTNLASAGLR